MEKCSKCQNKITAKQKIVPIVVGLYLFATSFYGTVQLLKKFVDWLN